MYLAHGSLRMPEQRLILCEPLVIAESRSRDGSTPYRRVFRAVGSVPGLTKEAYCPERADGAKFPSSYA